VGKLRVLDSTPFFSNQMVRAPAVGWLRFQNEFSSAVTVEVTNSRDAAWAACGRKHYRVNLRRCSTLNKS
jgi:hypothetical protein